MFYTGLRILLTLVCFICFSPYFTIADVIDFEDLYASYPSNVSEMHLPDGYHGFNWSDNTWVINAKDFYDDANWGEGTLGNVSIFGGLDNNSFPVGLNTSEPGSFNFESAYITSAYAGVHNNSGDLIAPEAYNVTVEGWQNGSLKYTQAVNVTGFKNEFAFEYCDIDTLWFKPELNTASQIVIDNIQYSRNQPVPESSSMLLFSIGLLIFSYSSIVFKKNGGAFS